MKTIFYLAVALLAAFSSLRATVPSPWIDSDIGSPATAGTATYSSGTFTVSGGGNDIYGTSDQFNYCYQQVSGSFTLTGRIVSTSGSGVNGGAASGLMFRESTAANARQITIYEEPEPGGAGTMRYTYRSATGDVSIRLPVVSDTFPAWFQVTRDGDLVHTSWSLDGSTWVEAVVQNFPNLSSTVCLGMAVTSRNNTKGVLNTATFDNVSLQSVQISTATSWLGNTFPGGGACVNYGVLSIYVDPTTGMLYTNGQSESYSTAIYDTTGNFVAQCCNSHFNGGYAVTADASYLYAAQTPVTSGSTGAGIAIYDHNGDPALSSTILLPTHTITGLACNRSLGQLYIADSGTYSGGPGTIWVYSTSTFAPVSSFPLSNPQNIALGTDGSLWIVQSGSGVTPMVLHYSTSGSVLSGSISGIGAPRGIAVDQNNLVYVADSGTDQNIKIFNSNGTLYGTFGAENGIYSGTCGAVAPNKLNYPTGVALDNNGNIWVACNGPVTKWGGIGGGTGAEIRKYTLSSGSCQWELKGLEYVDCASGDPATDGTDVFTKLHHYTMDYSKPTGQQWSEVGMTLDAVHYPNDARIVSAPGPSMVRRINGQRYLFTSDQQGGWLWFYRFQSGSEIAVPLGYLERETDRGKTDDAFAIWHDSNGNGQVDSGEVDTSGKPAGPPSNEVFCYSVDNNGGVWTMDGTNIRCYNPQTDSNGNLYYSSSSTALSTWVYPSCLKQSYPTVMLVRAYYDTTTDSLYLAGYSTDAPKTDTNWGYIGTRIFKYTNFKASGGAVNQAYELTVPRTSTMGARAMDITGGYLAYVISGPETSTPCNEIYLYDAASGSLVTTLLPGPEVAARELVDSNNGLELFCRSNGELLAFIEECAEEKVIMFRYNPFYADSIGTVTGGTASIVSGTYQVGGLCYSGSTDCQEYLCRGMSGNGTATVRLVSMAATSGSLSSNAVAGLEIRNSSSDLGSPYTSILCYSSTTGGMTLWTRSTEGGGVTHDHLANIGGLPQWLRLVRSGSNVTSYYSPDGSTWTQFGVQPTSLNQAVELGMMWYPASPTVGGTATFDNFSSTP